MARHGLLAATSADCCETKAVTIQAIHSSDTVESKGFVLPLLVGAGVLAFLLWTGNDLLQDSDLFWQIEVGRWIIDHRAVPDADLFSFTKPARRGCRVPGWRR